jgi:hypothetical protein
MKLTGRSKRTLLRWLTNPELHIRTWRPDRSVLLNRQDLLAAEARMDELAASPTFGRQHAALERL